MLQFKKFQNFVTMFRSRARDFCFFFEQTKRKEQTGPVFVVLLLFIYLFFAGTQTARGEGRWCYESTVIAARFK